MNNAVENFLNEIQLASNELQKFSSTIENKEEMIKQTLVNLQQYTTNLSTTVADNAFGQTIVDSTNMLKNYIQQWISNLEQFMDGKDFINQFEKSVVVAVFGNVNAGKSSLGNFIAGNTSVLKQIYNEQPEFYMYDLSQGDAQKGPSLVLENEFKEGAIETTASIQYFTLKGGLTWVDTPGIHSINTHNELLAKKYVDFADLILFLVPSSSPGKADEIEELSRLIEKEKSLLVAITKSDRITKDEVDGKLVKIEAPKSEKDRAAQENYLATVLKEKNVFSKIKDAQFTSISVNLAKKALENSDAQLFDDSGLPRFYKQIGQVLSSEALELKMKRPISQINATVDELVNGFDGQDGLTQIKEHLTSILQRIQQQKQNIYKEKQRIIDTLTSKAKLELDTELTVLKQKFDAGQKVSASDIGQTVERIILKHYEETTQKRLSNLIADVHVGQISALKIAMEIEFEKKTETIEQQYYDVDTVSRDPQGIIENVLHFFGKEYRESKVTSHTTSKTITIGNNFADVLMQAKKALDEQVVVLVEKCLADVERNYFDENERIMNGMLSKLEEAKQIILTLKIEKEVVRA